MDRKEFLGKSLQLAAGLGFACPCLVAAGDEPAPKPQTAPNQPSPCPRTSGEYPHATPFEKRADFAKTWTGRFMRVLDERLDEKTRRSLMEANGRACALGAYGPPDPAKKVGLDEFVAGLAKYVGSESARREGDVVFFLQAEPGRPAHRRRLLPVSPGRGRSSRSVTDVLPLLSRLRGVPVRAEPRPPRARRAARVAPRRRQGLPLRRSRLTQAPLCRPPIWGVPGRR